MDTWDYKKKSRYSNMFLIAAVQSPLKQYQKSSFSNTHYTPTSTAARDDDVARNEGTGLCVSHGDSMPTVSCLLPWSLVSNTVSGFIQQKIINNLSQKLHFNVLISASSEDVDQTP
jgi:hypothetical protein